jgi:hypothetical protein
MMQTAPLIDIAPNLFASLDKGYVIFNRTIQRGTQIKTGGKLPLSCFFDCYPIYLVGDKEQLKHRIGYYFESQFQVESAGAYLIAYFNKSRGKANAVEVVIKTDELIIYNVPNKGTVIVSMDISPALQTIIAEQ